jgi:DNA segregation ATPase FtsK/SpoIIIE, S-DNA-T family
MKIKLTLVRPGNGAVDLAVTAEPTSLIGDIARELYNADPSRTAGVMTDSGGVTLRVHRAADLSAAAGSVVLDHANTLADSDLASGVMVSLAPVASPTDRKRVQDVAAIVTVVEGPDAGKQFNLPAGSSSVGREAHNRIVLSDPLSSKIHARFNVTDVVEVVDSGSANGTLVNDEIVDRVLLAAGDRVTLGDTVLTVAPVAHSGATERSGVVQFNRSPRLDPTYVGVKLKAPEPPERPEPQRLPYLALLAPLVMGGVLLFVNPGNPLSVIFIALSPLLLVATFIDNLIQGRKQWKQAKQQFEESVAAIEADVDRLHDEERIGRLAEAPSVASVVAEGAAFHPLLWTRRPEHEAFLQVRLGLGSMPSRHELEMPSQRKGPAELWKMVEALQARTTFVTPVPSVENLRQSGSVGIAGPLDSSRAVARGVIAQIVGLHSPAELALGAIASTASARSWDWLKWLPHVGSAFSPISVPSLATGGPAATAIVSELEELIATRLEAEKSDAGSASLPTVVILVEDDAPVERARMVALAERGPAVGVHLVWVAPALARVPAACRTFVEINPASNLGHAGYVHTGYGVQPIECEVLAEADALAFARALSAAVDAGARVDDASDLPRSVSLLSLIGTDIATDSEAVIGRWQETNSILTGPRASLAIGKSKPNLRAVFGQAAADPFAVDLRTDGPHALVGGTTGSGKSEFLQAWVLGLAAAHSPQRVSFLFVDYKGGAAFADCLDLPHTVGLVTDLSPHLVRRALTSLRAELQYREHLFNRKKVKDIVEFERTGDPEVPPSLLIVVDEFAALATEVPEFVDGVVDVAQRGRSLGLHLILATQRPAGVIRDNLRANTNLRIALRMADEADSTDVLGTPMAAGFDPSIPGRGAAKTGPGRIRAFQSGYAGGWTSSVAEPSSVAIEELHFGLPVAWQPPADPAADERKLAATNGPTDIKRIVSTIRAASSDASIPQPRKPWLPELAPVYDFSRLPNKRTDEELVLGVVDDAATQSQPVVSYVPDRDGNMAIIGTGGSGKSTALRTIAVASAITMRGGPVHVYGLDFGAGGLQMLESLPHVGSIISGDDEERVARLLRWLRDLVDDRAVRFAEARAGNIVDYRKIAGRLDEPRILLLLDGMGAFREAYESSVIAPWFTVFSQIATDGRQVGVHVIVSGDRAGAIPTSLSSSIQRRLVLRLANADDYGMLGVDSDVLGPTSPPGRGLLDDQETQVAVLGGDGNVAVQARQIENLAASMVKAGIIEASPIERLKDYISTQDIFMAPGAGVPIGVADDTLLPLSIDPSGSFVVSGPPGSGRTNALGTIARAVKSRNPTTSLYLLSPRRSILTRMEVWKAAAERPDDLEATVAELAARVDSGLLKPGDVALFIETLSDFTGSPVEYELERVVKSLLKQEQFVVAESETSTWSQAYSLGQPLRAGRKGLLLQPDEGDGDLLLNTSVGRIRRGSLPPGRGFLIGQGRSRKLQVAMSNDET